jgi:excisionase family DNA binding protein
MVEQVSELPVLLTIREVAHRLSCSEATVRRMLLAGDLEPVRLRALPSGSVRVRAVDVDRLVNGEPIGDAR